MVVVVAMVVVAMVVVMAISRSRSTFTSHHVSISCKLPRSRTTESPEPSLALGDVAIQWGTDKEKELEGSSRPPLS
jgi:hypothetical protein